MRRPTGSVFSAHVSKNGSIPIAHQQWWLLSFVLLVFLPIPVAFLALVALGEEIGPPLAIALLCISGAGPFVEWMYFMLASREPPHETSVQGMVSRPSDIKAKL